MLHYDNNKKTTCYIIVIERKQLSEARASPLSKNEISILSIVK